jgi:hypothetical protein
MPLVGSEIKEGVVFVKQATTVVGGYLQKVW